MTDLHLSALLFVARLPGHCACSDVTRIQAGPFSIPVGPLTGIVALIAVMFLPPMFFGWVTRRREARAMRRVLGAESPLVSS